MAHPLPAFFTISCESEYWVQQPLCVKHFETNTGILDAVFFRIVLPSPSGCKFSFTLQVFIKEFEGDLVYCRESVFS